MKPCRKYRQQIALAIVDDEVDRHVSECATCAAYAKEVERIYGEHRERAEALPEAEAPARLHARVREAICLFGGASSVEPLTFFSKRIFGARRSSPLRKLLQGLGVAAAGAITLLAVLQLAPRKPVPAPAIVEVTKPEVPPIAEPTFAAYHNRLSRSVEEFEASLKDHGALNGGEVLKVSSASENLP
jgi:hypothetical protein